MTNVFLPVKEHILLAFAIVLGVAALWFWLAYRLAVRVYQKRDVV